MIYEALWQPLSASISRTGLLKAHPMPSSLDLSLLLVCRQIHDEAKRIAFTGHTFTLTRDFSANPLHYEPRTAPYMYIRSLLILDTSSSDPSSEHSSTSLTALSTPSVSFPPPIPPQGYSFKELLSLIRRFPRLSEIIIVEGTATTRMERSLRCWVAQYHFRLKKARHSGNERFAPSYSIRSLNMKDKGRGGKSGWRIEVAGNGNGGAGEGGMRGADLLIYGTK